MKTLLLSSMALTGSLLLVAAADKVVTLTEDEDHRRNVETRTDKLTMKAWRLKPKKAEPGK